eukprot:gnl/Trimastix_PCT/2105.p2 GENE.gnl/Trimastix_PCT/2105~~gnl/Trimastix_PCT/2105.p2  ORF type:complete len:267 (-),score=73.64 gnl/Trimastix_PCT/2105:395-1120(-)
MEDASQHVTAPAPSEGATDDTTNDALIARLLQDEEEAKFRDEHRAITVGGPDPGVREPTPQEDDEEQEEPDPQEEEEAALDDMRDQSCQNWEESIETMVKKHVHIRSMISDNPILNTHEHEPMECEQHWRSKHRSWEEDGPEEQLARAKAMAAGNIHLTLAPRHNRSQTRMHVGRAPSSMADLLKIASAKFRLRGKQKFAKCYTTDMAEVTDIAAVRSGTTLLFVSEQEARKAAAQSHHRE